VETKFFRVAFDGAVNASALTITGGTITGATIKATGGSNNDIWLNSSTGDIEFYYGGGTNKANISIDTSGNLIFTATDTYQFFDKASHQLVVFDYSETGDALKLIKGGIAISTAGTSISWSTGRSLKEDSDEIQCNGAFRATAYRVKPSSTTYYGADGTFDAAGTNKLRVRNGIVTDLTA
jgi:hypothetical protein